MRSCFLLFDTLTSVDMWAQIFLHGDLDRFGEPREARLVPPVVHPAAPLLGLDQALTDQDRHVMRPRRLRQADGPLDVAGAQAPLGARDQAAARPAARLEQGHDLQAGRVPESLEGACQSGRSLHTSMNLD